jgi:hypothetical protein
MIGIVVIELDEYRKKVCMRKRRSAIREFHDFYEYCLVKGYENYLHGYLWHVIEVGSVLAHVAEKQGQFVLVSLQFPKRSFNMEAIIEWLNNYSVVLHPRGRSIGKITEAQAIIKSILFKGNPILLYKKGTRTLEYNAGKLLEVTDPWRF